MIHRSYRIRVVRISVDNLLAVSHGTTYKDSIADRCLPAVTLPPILHRLRIVRISTQHVPLVIILTRLPRSVVRSNGEWFRNFTRNPILHFDNLIPRFARRPLRRRTVILGWISGRKTLIETRPLGRAIVRIIWNSCTIPGRIRMTESVVRCGGARIRIAASLLVQARRKPVMIVDGRFSIVGSRSMRRSARTVIRGHRGVSIFGMLGFAARRFRERSARERSGRRRRSIVQFLPNVGSIVVQLVGGAAILLLVPGRVNRRARAGRLQEIGVVGVQSRPGAGAGETVEHHVLGVSRPADRWVRVIRVVERVGDVRAIRVKRIRQRMDRGYGFRRGHVDGDMQQSVGDVRLLRLLLPGLLIEGRIHPYVGPVNGVVHEHGGIDGVILHDYGEVVGRVQRFLHYDPILLMDARLRGI